MLRRFALSLVVLAMLALPAAAGSGRSAALIETLRLPELLEVMRIEGIEHGTEIGDSLLGLRAGRGWADTVARIYRPDRMLEAMTDGLEAALPASEDLLDDMIAFHASERGRRVVELEISARRAMLDEAVEEAAQDRWAAMLDEDDPRVAPLRRFAEVGDLVEENVVGGLNSTYAFYMGLIEAGAMGRPMTEDEVLADVWAQEPGIRADIEEWLFAYLALAYGPLAEEDLDAYVAFFETPAGQALNAALFAGFHAMFETLSRELGVAAGRVLEAEDL